MCKHTSQLTDYSSVHIICFVSNHISIIINSSHIYIYILHQSHRDRRIPTTHTPVTTTRNQRRLNDQPMPTAPTGDQTPLPISSSHTSHIIYIYIYHNLKQLSILKINSFTLYIYIYHTGSPDSGNPLTGGDRRAAADSRDDCRSNLRRRQGAFKPVTAPPPSLSRGHRCSPATGSPNDVDRPAKGHGRRRATTLQPHLRRLHHHSHQNRRQPPPKINPK
ncbi:hypothetical protein Dimus_039240 [Dionaea muscipula]